MSCENLCNRSGERRENKPTALLALGKCGTPFGALRHHLSPVEAGALWVLYIALHDSAGKLREAYSPPLNRGESGAAG